MVHNIFKKTMAIVFLSMFNVFPVGQHLPRSTRWVLKAGAYDLKNHK